MVVNLPGAFVEHPARCIVHGAGPIEAKAVASVPNAHVKSGSNRHSKKPQIFTCRRSSNSGNRKRLWEMIEWRDVHGLSRQIGERQVGTQRRPAGAHSFVGRQII